MTDICTLSRNRVQGLNEILTRSDNVLHFEVRIHIKLPWLNWCSCPHGTYCEHEPIRPISFFFEEPKLY